MSPTPPLRSNSAEVTAAVAGSLGPSIEPRAMRSASKIAAARRARRWRRRRHLAEDRLQGRGSDPQALRGDPRRRSAQARRRPRQGAGPGRADPRREHEVLRAERGVLIVETHHGFVCANAGIDSSNLPEPDTVCLLPEDPDASARRDPRRDRRRRRAPGRRGRLLTASAAPGGSVRPRWRSAAPGWRRSMTGAGAMTPAGRELEATLIAIADEAAAAADLVRDKASGVPAAVVRGLGRHVSAETARRRRAAPPAGRGPLPLVSSATPDSDAQSRRRHPALDLVGVLTLSQLLTPSLALPPA